MSEGEWTLRDYQDGDEGGMLDLLTEAFGEWPATDIRVPPIDHLRWKLAGAQHGPQYVVDTGSQIVGCRILIARHYEVVQRAAALRSGLVELFGCQRIQRPGVDLEPAVTSAFCALKAAKASSFSRSGTLK